MKTLKFLLVTLVLAIAACRSVPTEVRQAHDLSMVESEQAMGIASDTLTKIETKSEELNDESVSAAFNDWSEHMAKIIEARNVVANYLNESKAGEDVTGPYTVAQIILSDMHNGFSQINRWWADMLKEENDAAAAQFVAMFRRDIDRFRTLERKFDEWIKQFKVRG